MANQPTDGGSAFPALDYFAKPDGSGGVPVSHGGMSLRDYFAAQCYSVLIVCDESGGTSSYSARARSRRRSPRCTRHTLAPP